MKATLAFDLPDEQDDFDNACSGHKWRSVVDDLDNWLRDQLKYHEPSADRQSIFESLREQIRFSCEGNGVSLN